MRAEADHETAAHGSTPLRVSMFTPWRDRCGISDYSKHLAAELRTTPEIRDLRIVEAPPFAEMNSGAGGLGRAYAASRRYRSLGMEMNRPIVDLAHVQHQYFFFGGVAPHKSHIRAFLNYVRAPLVMTVHEIARAVPTAKPWLRWSIEVANRINFRHPTIRQMIVHTHADRDRLIALGISPDRVHRIAMAGPRALPMPDADAAKRTLGLTGARVVTLFGFLAAKKGHRLALDALPYLPADTALMFAGDRHPDDRTDYVSRLHAEIEARGLGARVRITGYLPDANVPVAMAATDVAIAPFLETSGSASLAHLLAYERPTLISDIGPHREIASEEPACVALFRSGDSGDLAAGINALLEDAPRRETLQAAARVYARRHSYEAMARETVRIYRLAT